MLTTAWFSLGLVVLITAIVVMAGIKKQPGLGIILAVIILGVAIGFNKLKLSDIGFSASKSWLATILWRLGLGIVIGFVSTLIIKPAAEKIAGQSHNLSILEKNSLQLETIVLLLALAWHAGTREKAGLPAPPILVCFSVTYSSGAEIISGCPF